MTSPAALAYPIRERVLDNGLRVLVSEDHGTPSVAVNIWYDVGSRHEISGRTGFAHLFEHLMFQGSAHVASGEHIQVMQAAGASVNATTWFDRTNYFEALPVGGLELALWLEADRMGTLLQALTQDNLNTQREVVKEEKRQRYDNVPYGDVMERLIGLTFPATHPYGHPVIGSMADLDAATLADVHAFFESFYMPNNARLVVVGDVEEARAFALAETYFGALAPGERPEPLHSTQLPPLTDPDRVEATADVPADAVYLSWRLPPLGTRAFDAVDLAFTVLGHGQSSRVYRRLVRRESAAETASASTLGLVGGNSFGYASARSQDGEPVAALEEALLEEVVGLATRPASDLELRRAKAVFERQLLHSLARVDSRADEINAAVLQFGDAARVNTRVAEIDDLTAGDLSAAVADWLAPDGAATLVYRAEPAGSR